MSIVTDWMSTYDRMAFGERPFPVEERHQCFYCYEPVETGVHWMGSTSEIYLHPRCYHALMVRLARDIWELEIHDIA